MLSIRFFSATVFHRLSLIKEASVDQVRLSCAIFDSSSAQRWMKKPSCTRVEPVRPRMLGSTTIEVDFVISDWAISWSVRRDFPKPLGDLITISVGAAFGR